MNAARLRETVTIQAVALGTADSYRGQLETWSDVETVRARIQQAGASERMASRLVMAEATHLVTMRYTPNMDAKKRLKWVVDGTARYLNPTAVETDERRRTMTVTCTETL